MNKGIKKIPLPRVETPEVLEYEKALKKGMKKTKEKDYKQKVSKTIKKELSETMKKLK